MSVRQNRARKGMRQNISTILEIKITLLKNCILCSVEALMRHSLFSRSARKWTEFLDAFLFLRTRRSIDRNERTSRQTATGVTLFQSSSLFPPVAGSIRVAFACSLRVTLWKLNLREIALTSFRGHAPRIVTNEFRASGQCPLREDDVKLFPA